MKKVIIFLAIAIFMSCDKDEIDDCNCTMKVYVSDGETIQHYFVTGVPSDCNGNVTVRPDNVAPDHFPTMKCE